MHISSLNIGLNFIQAPACKMDLSTENLEISQENVI